MWRWSIGWGRSNHSASSSFQGREPLVERREVLGRRHVGHRELVLQPLLVVVERGLEVVDGPAVLNGDHPPGGEGAAVADAVDVVEDRRRGVARSQEVRVQRVHEAVLDGAPGRHEGLPGHLAAVDTLSFLVGLDAAEDVDLNRLEVEQVDEELQRGAHGAHVRRRRRPGTAAPCPATVPLGHGSRVDPERAHLSRRVRLGCRHRRPPDRGRQRQQRLVGAGSTRRVRGRWSRAATPATPSTAGARTWSWWPTWVSAPTASRSSGAASSRRRESSRWPRSTTTAGSAPPVAGTGSSRSSRSTTSPRPGGWPPGAAGRRPTPPTASPAT